MPLARKDGIENALQEVKDSLLVGRRGARVPGVLPRAIILKKGRNYFPFDDTLEVVRERAERLVVLVRRSSWFCGARSARARLGRVVFAVPKSSESPSSASCRAGVSCER